MLIWDRTGKNENGFTLIETLVAMVILSIALLGIAQMQLSAMQGNRSSYDMTEASALGSDMIEQMVLQNWKDPTTVACPVNDSVVRSNITYNRICTCTLPGGGSCTTPPPDGSIGQRVATVTVTWQGKNSTHSLVVNSLL
jgi:prepilin-type N-terminal cleavage/methylation domain-containing protein